MALDASSAYQPLGDMGDNGMGSQPNYFQGYNPFAPKTGPVQMGGGGPIAQNANALPQQAMNGLDPKNLSANDPFHVNWNPNATKDGSNSLDPSQWMGTGDINFTTNNQLWKYGLPGVGQNQGYGAAQSFDLNTQADQALRSLAVQPGQMMSPWGNPANSPYSAMNQFMQLWDPNGQSQQWSPYAAAQRAQTWEQAISNYQNTPQNGFTDDQRSQMRNAVQNAYMDILNRARASGAMGVEGTNTFDPNQQMNGGQ